MSASDVGLCVLAAVLALAFVGAVGCLAYSVYLLFTGSSA